jgi:RNA polymerase sigma-70 factor (ECF subfamily)
VEPVVPPRPRKAARPETPAIDFPRRIEAELPALRRYVRRLAGAGEDAEDLLQETLARALRSGRRFDPAVGTLAGWLRTTARNAWRDHAERRARRPEALGPRDAELPAPEMAAADAHDEREELKRMLARLPETERDVLLRFHARGESVAEIATALGMPPGTVKSHLHRARRRLAEREGRR